MKFIKSLSVLILLTTILHGQSFRLTKKPNSPAPTETKVSIGECLGTQLKDTIYFPTDLRLIISTENGEVLTDANVSIMALDTNGGILLSSLIFPISEHPTFHSFLPENTFTLTGSGSFFIVDFNFQAISQVEIRDIIFLIDVDQIPNAPKMWDFSEKFCLSNSNLENKPISLDFRSLNESESYSIFPNPSSGEFYISFDFDSIFFCKIEIYDQFGRIIDGYHYEICENGSKVKVSGIKSRHPLAYVKCRVNNLYFTDAIFFQAD